MLYWAAGWLTSLLIHGSLAADQIQVEPFIRDLPKVELHIHIEGTLTPRLRWDLAQKNNVTLPYKTFEELQASYDKLATLPQDNYLPAFLEGYYGGMDVLLHEEDFYQLAMDYYNKSVSLNVRYSEVYFDIQAHTRRNVSVANVMNGFLRAKTEAKAKYNYDSTFILAFLRELPVESAQEHYDLAAPWRGTLFNAVGLDSDERNRPPILFDSVYRQARKDGLKLTAHCDVNQQDTYEHIRQAAVEVGGGGLDRIDHGLNAADKQDLIDAIKGRGIGLTLCPAAYSLIANASFIFPRVRTLYDAGIPITVNSDDPTYMRNYYVSEALQMTEDQTPFSREEVVQLQRNAIAISWASPLVKAAFMEELEAYVVNLAGE
ncbi:putative deaminase [Cercospora zeina]